MSFASIRPSFFPFAFVGVLLWGGVAMSSAHADEALTPIAKPAARLDQSGACRVVSPRFEPKAHAKTFAEARFAGGATLRFPVATPCPRRTADVEV